MAANLDLGSANLTIGADGTVAHRVLADLESQLESLPPALQLGSKEAQNFRQHLENLATGTETAVAKSLKSLSLMTQQASQGGGVFNVAKQDAEEFNEFVKSAVREIERITQERRSAAISAALMAEEAENIAQQERKLLAIEEELNRKHLERIHYMRTEEDLAADIQQILMTEGRGGLRPGQAPWSLKDYFAGADKEVAKSASTVLSGSRKMEVAITQLGFAVEDFVTVVGPMGLAGGLRAAGNNLSFVASMFNPVAGLVTGIGLATLALVLQLSKMEKQALKTGKAMLEMGRSISLGFREAQRAAQEDMGADLPDIEYAIETQLDRFQSKRKELKDALADSNKDLQSFSRDRQDIINKMRVFMPDFEELGISKVVEKVFAGGSLGGGGVGAGGAYYTVVTESAEIFEKRMLDAIGRVDVAARNAQKNFTDQNKALLQTALLEVTKVAKDAAANVGEGADYKDFLPEGFAELADGLADAAASSDVAYDRISKLRDLMEELGTQEWLSKGLIEPFKEFGTGAMADAQRALQQFNDEWDRVGKIQQENRKQAEKEMQRVQQIIDQTRTPLEKFSAAYGELVDLSERGLLDADTFQRAVQLAEEEFQSLTKDETKNISINFTGVEGIEAGSAEALARIQGAFDSFAAPVAAGGRDPMAELAAFEEESFKQAMAAADATLFSGTSDRTSPLWQQEFEKSIEDMDDIIATFYDGNFEPFRDNVTELFERAIPEALEKQRKGELGRADREVLESRLQFREDYYGRLGRPVPDLPGMKETDKNTDAVMDLSGAVKTLTGVITERGGTLASEVISGLFEDSN